MTMATLAGYRTRLNSFGTGPRKALLIHCSLAHSGAYARLGHALGDAMTLVGFDLPGHGGSEDWTGPGDIQDQMLAMAAELLTEPMDVIGHSIGGNIALHLAALHPDKVRSATLIEPVMQAVAIEDEPEWKTRISDDMRAYFEAIQTNDAERAARAFTSQYGDGRPWDTLHPEARRAITERIHLIKENDRAALEDHFGLLKPHGLDAVSMPVLIMDGGVDVSGMLTVCKGLARRIPQARQVSIAGGGHMVPFTKPDVVAQEILSLVSQPQPV